MIEITIKGKKLRFDTNPHLFCPNYIDIGTLAMLSTFEFKGEERILDLGCGYGVVGILSAQFIKPQEVFMVDIDPEAVNCSARNANMNGVRIPVKVATHSGGKLPLSLLS